MHGPKLRVALGAKIRTLRKQEGWTQLELARRTQLHRTYIADIERGSRNVSFDNLLKLAEAFGLVISELCSGIEKAPKRGTN